MKETKPYWYHNTAYSIASYLVYHDFPNLLTQRLEVNMPITLGALNSVQDNSLLSAADADNAHMVFCQLD